MTDESPLIHALKKAELTFLQDYIGIVQRAVGLLEEARASIAERSDPTLKRKDDPISQDEFSAIVKIALRDVYIDRGAMAAAIGISQSLISHWQLYKANPMPEVKEQIFNTIAGETAKKIQKLTPQP